MSLRRRWIFGGLLLLSAATGMVWFTGGVAHQKQPATQSVIVERKAIAQQVLASGAFSLASQLNIGAQVNGQIKALHVSVGDKVKKGDLLLEIDPILARNALKKAQARLTSYDARIVLKKKQIAHLSLTLRRKQALRELDGISLADVESARLELEAEEQERVVLMAEREQAEIEVGTERANVGYTRILAPMEGTVLLIVAREGQTIVSAQSSPTLIVLGDPQKMVVRAQISEADMMNVAVGQEAQITVPARQDKRYVSQLKEIEMLPEGYQGSSSESSSGGKNSSGAIFYSGIFLVDNTDEQLRPAMSARVRIETNRVADALVIPLIALGKQRDKSRFEVAVRTPQGTKIREIQTGIISDQEAQVISGLREGEQVLIPEAA
ncbi:efflux RND transporter periplasmic adaptor subunit [Enterobacteriaceae bacterium C23F]